MNSPTEQFPHPDDWFRLIVESLEDYAIFSVNFKGYITTWNAGAERLLGYAREEAIGQPLALIFGPEDTEVGLPEQEIERALTQGSITDERWHVRKDGNTFWASGRLSALYGASDKPIGLIKIVRDLTERHESQQKLEEMNQQLQAQFDELRALGWELTRAEQEERRHFANQLHEELAQLLASGRMSLVAMRRSGTGAQDTAATDLEALLQRAVQFVQRLIAALTPTVLEEVGLTDGLHWLASLMQRDFELTVHLDIRGDPNPRSNVVRVLLFQAARELLMNVAQHASVSEANLSLWRDEEYIYLRVTDQGVGYTTMQLAQPVLRDGRLGLGRLRSRLDLIGGAIEISSGPRKGTSVQLTIPALAANMGRISSA